VKPLRALACRFKVSTAVLFSFSLAFALALALGAAAQGLVFEPDEAYAQYPKLERHRAFLPERVDLSARFPTPGDQGDQGSCVGWAVGYAARSYYAVTREGRARNQIGEIPSPAYIYGAIKPPGDCDTGSLITRALDLLSRDGAVSLARYPYNDRMCPAPSRAPSPQFRIANWRAINVGVIDDVKGALAKGHPVVIGSLITKEFIRLRGDVVWRGGGDRIPGGHAMTLVGYDERRQAFKVINSWGVRWGDGGFGWIGYEAYRMFTRQAYVMDVAAGPPPFSPAPPAPPGPAPQPGPAPAPSVTLDPPLASYQCASLEPVQAGNGVTVRGFVGTEGDLGKLVESAKRIGIRVEVAVRPWPQCETLLTFKEVFAEPGAPELRLRGDKREYRKGEPLIIEVTTPPTPSYLYLVYVQASGGVVYLVQPRGAAPTPQPQARTIVLGDGSAGGPRFTIDGPYGDEMILAIASQSPLFDEGRPSPETERDFLTAFRKALLVPPTADAGKRKVSGAWIALTTKE
jgi:hypothetical protein